MHFVDLVAQNGLEGDICAQSFGPFFDEAVGLVGSACTGFIDPVE
jgi:hypothetical protein